jgi:cell division transport system permease protein
VIDRLLGTPYERRLLGGGRFSGPTAWLIAIMMFVMLSVAAAGLALAGSARLVSEGVARRHMVQITDGRSSEATAVAALRRAPGVVRVAPVPEAELRRTLERWLGAAARDPDAALPIPVLIDVELAPGASPQPVAAALKQAVPRAALISNSGRLGPMLRAVASLAWLAAAIVALVALATAAAVVLATRSALAAHRSTIEVMHGIGATDRQISGLFQRKIAVDALAGGLAGGLAAGAALLLVSAGSLASAGEWTGGRLLGTLDLIMLALLPFIGAALATAVARWTILQSLRANL